MKNETLVHNHIRHSENVDHTTTFHHARRPPWTWKVVWRWWPAWRHSWRKRHPPQQAVPAPPGAKRQCVASFWKGKRLSVTAHTTHDHEQIILCPRCLRSYSVNSTLCALYLKLGGASLSQPNLGCICNHRTLFPLLQVLPRYVA